MTGCKRLALYDRLSAIADVGVIMPGWLLRVSQIAAIAFVCFAPALASAQDTRGGFTTMPLAQVKPVIATGGMVVAQETRAAHIGVECSSRAATRSTPRSPPALRWR